MTESHGTAPPEAASAPPDAVEAKAKKGDDEARKGVLEALGKLSEHLSVHFITFLAVSIYLAITVGGTKDRHLLLGQELILPLLGVGIPAKWFYTVAPLFYLALHVNFFCYDSILLLRLQRWGELIRQERDSLFPSFSLLRLFRDDRVYLFSSTLSRVFYWLILAYLPPGLLFLMQWRFVRYHPDRLVLREQQIVLLLDVLVIVAMLWLRHHVSRRLRRPLFSRTGLQRLFGGLVNYLLFAAFAAELVTLSLFVASHPSSQDDCRTVARAESMGALWKRLRLPLKTALDISGEALDNDTENSKGRRWTVDLSGRDLRCADFSGAHLAGFDFRKAKLQNADFSGAHLENADFRGANLEGARFDGAVLPGADFSFSGSTPLRKVCALLPDELPRTNLAQASFDYAQLDNARFDGADLFDASFVEAKAPGAVFCSARTHGTHFQHADLFGANFSWAKLYGADLSDATLSLSSLLAAGLEFAILARADLTGADLSGAKTARTDFLGANLGLVVANSLRFSTLREADLRGSDLCQGLELEKFSLALMDLTGVKLGRFTPELLNPVAERVERDKASLPKPVLDRLAQARDRLKADPKRGLECLTDFPAEVSVEGVSLPNHLLYDSAAVRQAGLNWPAGGIDIELFERERSEQIADIVAHNAWLIRFRKAIPTR